MGQNRGVKGLPSPRLFRSDDERFKWDTRVYDAISALKQALDDSGILADDGGPQLWEPQLVFFGSADQGFRQVAEFFYAADDDGVALLTVPRVQLAASDSTTGTAPIYFDSDSVLTGDGETSLSSAVLEESCLENWDPWLYYTASATDDSSDFGGERGEGVVTPGRTARRYQLMGMFPGFTGEHAEASLFDGRGGVATGCIPFGIDTDFWDGTLAGTCVILDRLKYEVDYNAFLGTSTTDYLYAPRLYLHQAGAAASTPAFRMAAATSVKTTAGAGSPAAYPTIAAPDIGQWTGAIEIDGDALYFTGASGTRRALVMHDAAATSGGVTGSGANTRVTFWSSTSVLTSDSLFIYDSTNDWLGVGGAPADVIHAQATLNTSAGVVVRNSSTGASALTTMFFGSSASISDALIGIVGSGNSAYAGARSMVVGTYSANTPIAFVTNNTERMRLEADGDLVIGATTALARLHVEKNQNGQSYVVSKNGTDGTAALAGFVALNPSNQGIAFQVFAPTWTTSGLNIADYGQIAVDSGISGFVIKTQDAVPIIFGTNDTARARFSGNGRLLVGNTNDSAFIIRAAGHVGPDGSGMYDLGSSSLLWGRLYTVDVAVNTTSVGTFNVCVGGNIGPSANITYDLGSSSFRFLDTHSSFYKSATASVAAAASLMASTQLTSVTGNTNIDFIGMVSGLQAGTIIVLQFTGTPTVNHNTAGPGAGYAAIYLAGAANFAATANDTLTLVYNGTVWSEVARAVI